MAAKNPSSVIFWNDLENDEQLKTCSLAAKGLWDHHMLPIAARSAEPGVIVLGNHPSRLVDDLPALLARACGEAADVIVRLLRELVDSGAASVDESGRVYNRRMVREEAIRKVRSEAGKRGADATNAGRQKSGKHPGNNDGNGGVNNDGNGGVKPSGKNERPEQSKKLDGTAMGGADEKVDSRQNAGNTIGNDLGNDIGERADKTAHSSLLHASYSNDVTTNSTEVTGGADAPEDDALDQPLFLASGDVRLAVDIWNEGAARVGWPKVQKITAKRRRLMIARLGDCGGIAGWKIAIAKAEASSFLTGKTGRTNGHENWRCGLDFILGEDQFTKLMEGGHDDAPGSAKPRASNLSTNLQALADWGREGSGG